MANTNEEEMSTSRRPKDTKFKQQKLPAWQPVMTASNVLPLMFAIGVSFIPLGVAFLITSNNVQEVTVDYTKCMSVTGSDICAQIVSNNSSNHSCICIVNFTLATDFIAPVYIYYGLTNFYQNHRRYVKSRDDNQLLGTKETYNGLSTDCQPFQGVANSSQTSGGIPYAPCGAIANSKFNDSMLMFFKNDSTPVNLINTGIAWSTDRYSKFKNPQDFQQNPAGAFNSTLPPPYWQNAVYKLDPDNPNNNGYDNEDLMVWMRTAALPTFRKFYRRVNHTGVFVNGLPAGDYYLYITYNYPVTQFNGSKRIIITTTSWLGGKNPFLGIAYLVVGALCIIIGLVFLIIHLKVGKGSTDMRNMPLTSRTTYYDPHLRMMSGYHANSQ